MKEEKIEFRCPTSMKEQILRQRTTLRARTLSAAIRTLLEISLSEMSRISAAGCRMPFNEIIMHLDRIASALQHSTLDARVPTDVRHELGEYLGRLDDILRQIKRN